MAAFREWFILGIRSCACSRALFVALSSAPGRRGGMSRERISKTSAVCSELHASCSAEMLESTVFGATRPLTTLTTLNGATFRRLAPQLKRGPLEEITKLRLRCVSGKWRWIIPVSCLYFSPFLDTFITDSLVEIMLVPSKEKKSVQTIGATVRKLQVRTMPGLRFLQNCYGVNSVHGNTVITNANTCPCPNA